MNNINDRFNNLENCGNRNRTFNKSENFIKNKNPLALLNMNINVNNIKINLNIPSNNKNTTNISKSNNEDNLEDKTTSKNTFKNKKKKKKKKTNHSKEESIIQTPKFKQMNNNYLNNVYLPAIEGENCGFFLNPLENLSNLTNTLINIKFISLKGLRKDIDELCNNHSLFPPNDILNIFCNSAEIIHRNFFYLSIKKYLGEIFFVEEDKLGIIKIEDLYNYFLYIRSLKIMLMQHSKKEKFLSSSIIDNDDL